MTTVSNAFPQSTQLCSTAIHFYKTSEHHQLALICPAAWYREIITHTFYSPIYVLVCDKPTKLSLCQPAALMRECDICIWCHLRDYLYGNESQTHLLLASLTSVGVPVGCLYHHQAILHYTTICQSFPTPFSKASGYTLSRYSYITLTFKCQSS